MKRPLKILLLEDSKADADLIQRQLTREKMHCEFHLTTGKTDFLKALNEYSPDVILSDHSLPQFNSTDALKLARLKLPNIPFIMVTGAVSEEFAANIIKQGADDYILKDRMARLPAAIAAALKQRRVEKEKQDTAEQLKENEKKYRTLVERVSDGFIALDLNWGFTYINKKAEELFDRPPGYLLGKNIWVEFPEAVNKAFYKTYHRALENQMNIHLSAYSFAINKWVESDIYSSPTGISVYFRDVTEQKKAEEIARKSEEDYRTIMERVSDAFVSIDTDWVYTYVNKQAGEIMNRDPKQLIGKHIWTEFPEAIDQPFYKAYYKAMRDQQYIHLEEYYPPFDLWLENHIYPSTDGLSIFFRNITERKKAEMQIQESERKYRTIFLKSPLPIWIYDFETLKFLDVNESAIKHYGYSREEFLNMTIKDIRPPEELTLLEFDLAKIQEGSDSRHGNWRHLKKNGELIIVETTAHFIEYGSMKARMIIANDVTEKIKAEEELRRSAERLNEAQAIAHISNWEIDFVQNIHAWSDEFYRIYGLNKTEVQPSAELFLSLMHPDDADFAQKKVAEAFASIINSSFNFRFIRKDGAIRHGYTEWRFEFDEKGRPTRLFGILQDITERNEAEESLKNLEAEIFNQKIEEQKKIARAIITGQEKERNRIGQELHDNINQILAGTRMYLSIAGKKSDEVMEIIKYPMELIDSSIKEIRELCQKMVTPLKNIDLEMLVRELLDKLEHTSTTKTKLVYKISNGSLSDDLKLNIYRIIQEQVNNITKYAEAKKVNISITSESRMVIVIVEDKGKGFDVDAKRKGIGISNMINRVETFNGEVEIKSNPGKGCKITIKIPC